MTTSPPSQPESATATVALAQTRTRPFSPQGSDATVVTQSRTRTLFSCDSKVSPIVSAGHSTSLEVHKNNRTKILRDLNMQLARLYIKFQQVGNKERDSKFLEQEVEVIRGNCMKYATALSLYLINAADSHEWLDLDNSDLRMCFTTFYLTAYKVLQAFRQWKNLKPIVKESSHQKASSIFSVGRSNSSLDDRLGLFRESDSLDSDMQQLEKILTEARPALSSDFEKNMLMSEDAVLEGHVQRRRKLFSLCCLSCDL